MPTLSVIVPVYNAEQYLARCIDSILAQTFSDFECIIVEDGSTDNGGAMCDEYALKDSRIKVIHKQNAGVSAARNDGITAACGTYIAFVDSDDYIQPSMYQDMIRKIEDANSDIVYCGYLHNEILYSPPHSTEYLIYGSIAETIYRMDISGLFGLIWNKLYKKEIIQNNRIRFPAGYYFGEDMFFNLQYFNAINTVAVIPPAYYFYSVNQNSISKRRPSFEHSLFRFRNISSQIVQLKDRGNWINRILAFQFIYTVFLIRSLYHPLKKARPVRNSIIGEIKRFYRWRPARGPFESLRYAVFYNALMSIPFCFFDAIASLLFYFTESLRSNK